MPGAETKPHNGSLSDNDAHTHGTTLADGSRIGVVGGGPSGTFFTYFLLKLAKQLGINIEVDIYEPRDFWGVGPASCNMCGGIISESLVQYLALEGISLPPTIVQRTIDSYVLNTHEGSVRIDTPLKEKRIAAVYRAGGPRGVEEIEWGSFDGYLLALAIEKGAFLHQTRVDDIDYSSEKPKIIVKGHEPEEYDLVVLATGVNSPTLNKLEESVDGYRKPDLAKAFMREYFLAPEEVDKLGNSMHLFLLNIPNLEFAALIPKGTHISTCLLGEKMDKKLFAEFMSAPEVRACMPHAWDATENTCQCAPRMNVGGAGGAFGDRVVFVGDAAVTRLYKDGIGAAYRTAKSAASTALLQGVSEADFRRHYLPTCEAIEKDNDIGRMMFGFTEQIQKRSFALRAIMRMTANEQRKPGASRRMSMVLWDLFTGSAPYRDILMRTLRPTFLIRLFWYMVTSPFVRSSNETYEKELSVEVGPSRQQL